jgi:flagellar biosynthesis protein FlhB
MKHYTHNKHTTQNENTTITTQFNVVQLERALFSLFQSFEIIKEILMIFRVMLFVISTLWLRFDKLSFVISI